MLPIIILLTSLMLKAESEFLTCSEHRSPLICKNKRGQIVQMTNPGSDGGSKLTGEIKSFVDQREKELMSWERYINGKLQERKSFHSNGSLQHHIHYKNGVQDGISVEYNDKRQLMNKSTWVNSQRNGPFETYNIYDGKLRMKGLHKDGQQNGFATEYLQNNKQQISCYHEGNATDDWSLCDSKYKNKTREETRYFDNGDLRSKIGFLNEKKEGVYVFYYPKEMISVRGQHKNNEPIGEWYWNTKEGVKEKTISYKSKTDFTEKKFYSNGQVSEETVKANNKLISVILYYMNGQKKSEMLFEVPNTTASFKAFDDKGRVIEQGKKIAHPSRFGFPGLEMDFDGLVKSFDYEKNTRDECEMKATQVSGWCRKYDLKNDTLMSEKKYENDRMSVEKIYENGKLKSSREFYEDGSEKKTEN